MMESLRTDHEHEDMSNSKQPDVNVTFKVIPLTDDTTQTEVAANASSKRLLRCY